MFCVSQIERELRLAQPATPTNVVQYMLTQPLQFAPGEKSVYSNFGYCVLGRVLEKTYRRSYIDCLEQLVCRPLEIKDVKLGSGKRRDPREVWYPVADNVFSLDVMDAHGGLIASTPALCRFLDAYWISGEPRETGQRQEWTFFGSLPGATAMVRQRLDGTNVAVSMNGRRDKQYNEDNDVLRKAVEEAVGKTAK
jgi:N-acyl-D-amino-acid deacylase